MSAKNKVSAQLIHVPVQVPLYITITRITALFVATVNLALCFGVDSEILFLP